ncbi:YceI family protein [Tepidiforma sp.]|uniref:YceI family protein n=1 Tax=Tepidiforma sp. TaxID=2682230 RepID=UPI002ADD99E6|nr:YceI family protein [Tepidiforma sp.]
MKRRLLISGGAVVVAAVLAAVGVWYFYLRSDAPEEVSLEGALETVRTPTAAAGSGGTPAATAPASGGQQGSGQAAGVAGTWGIASQGETFVGYRVKEELAQVGAVTAVGRTKDVKGTVTIQGNTVKAGSSFTANMQALQSDRSQRDNALRRQALETDRFPTSTFTLSEDVTLPEGFANGEEFSTTLKGKLELHGVTRAVEIPVQAKVESGLIVVVGSAEIVFADYDIAQPRAAIVLSVEDRGVLEFQLVLARN